MARIHPRRWLLGGLLEIGRYLMASPHSRLYQRARLRELDERALADIGLTRRQAGRNL